MSKRVLITAGSTIVPIDQVRVISNIFRGSTGTAIAKYFAQQNDEVTLLTSNPTLLADYTGSPIKIVFYCTFNGLSGKMEELINCPLTVGDWRKNPLPEENFDVIIHSAAVSDYRAGGVYLEKNGKLEKIDSSKKVSSRHQKLFLELTPTIKLVDQIRNEWGFMRGILVKFKLEVGISDKELIEIAKKSREASEADLIVANCLEWANRYAYIIDRKDEVVKVSRGKLPRELYRRTR